MFAIWSCAGLVLATAITMQIILQPSLPSLQDWREAQRAGQAYRCHQRLMARRHAVFSTQTMQAPPTVIDSILELPLHYKVHFLQLLCSGDPRSSFSVLGFAVKSLWSWKLDLVLCALSSQAVLLDQFGVLHDGQHPYPDAIAAVQALADRGLKLFVLSNSSRSAQNSQTNMQ